MKTPPGRKELYHNGKLVGYFDAIGDTEIDIITAHKILNDLGYGTQEFPAWMHIRQQAIYFQDTCALLMRHEHQREKHERPFALLPYVVNSVFCIELYLKALSLKHGKSAHGHKLAEIYRALPKQAATDIETSVPEALKIAPLNENPDISRYLQELNDVYVRWRYAYEHERTGEVRFDILHFLRMVMFLACRNEIPSNPGQEAELSSPR